MSKRKLVAVPIVIATRNPHKLSELSTLLRVRGITWRSLADFPQVAPVAEHGRTFEANAVEKARAVARATGCLALADDSGIEVDALHGAPGVRSARFANRHGDDAANNRKLLRLLEGTPLSRRGAAYHCVLALASPTGLVAVAHGRWRGRIALAPRGRGGFGYDSIFLVPGKGRTVGELPARLKRRLSHRAQAAKRLRPVLQRLARRGGVTRRSPAAASPARR